MILIYCSYSTFFENFVTFLCMFKSFKYLSMIVGCISPERIKREYWSADAIERSVDSTSHHGTTSVGNWRESIIGGLNCRVAQPPAKGTCGVCWGGGGAPPASRRQQRLKRSPLASMAPASSPSSQVTLLGLPFLCTLLFQVNSRWNLGLAVTPCTSLVVVSWLGL